MFYFLYLILGFDTTIKLFDYYVDFKFMFGPIIILIFTSTTNSTNLTDGVDGLLSVTTIPIIIGFIVFSFFSRNYIVMSSSIAMLISLLVFLFFNFPKATIFMGDTGSLMIGAFICTISIILKLEFLMLIFCLIYIIETLSVILQVIYFKKTKGQRLFKMAPIHHHFELIGWSDFKINLVYLITSSVLVLISIMLELVIF